MHPLQPEVCGRCGSILLPDCDGDLVSWACRCGWHAEMRLHTATCNPPAEAPLVDRSGYAKYLALCLTRQEFLFRPAASEVSQLLFLNWLVQNRQHPEYVGVMRWAAAR